MQRRATVYAAAGFALFFAGFFWVVLGRGLIIGDAADQLIEALPAYLDGHPFWQPLSMLGFPETANPLSVTWYPLAALRYVSGSFDAYVVSAYVVAAIGAFGLARRISGSIAGGAIAGFVYALSGFMIGHAGHVDITHPAAWVPWVFWALVALREKSEARILALAALAVATLALAGQPQVLTYTLFAIAAFVCVGRSWRFARDAAAALALGGALAAVALVPGTELALHSVRTALRFEDHVGFAAPLASLPFRLLFPYLLGQTVLPPYTQSALNIGSFAEMSNYAGISTLALALLGAVARTGIRTGFWIGLFVVALALSTGNDLGLGALTYHVPFLNWYRAPGRYAFEVALAVAVLAASGVAAIERRAVTGRTVALCFAVIAAVMAVLLGVLAVFGRTLVATIGAAYGLTALPPHVLDPAANAALWMPPCVMCIGAAATALLIGRPQSPARRTLLVAACAADLASFAWFGYWNYGAFPLARLTPPPYAAALRAAIEPARGRVLSMPSEDVSAAIPPNLNVLWGIAGARGYTTLELGRSAAFLRTSSLLALRDALAPGDAALDAAGVRFAVVPAGMPELRPPGDPFDPASALGIRAGSGEPGVAPSVQFALPAAYTASRVAVVSYLVDGAGLAPGSVVAELRLTTAGGEVVTMPLRFGAGPQHVDILPLPAPVAVRRLEIHWTAPAAFRGLLDVERLSLLDDAGGVARPITALTFLLADPQRWRPIAEPGGDRVFENVRALPRAWLVHTAATAGDDAALAAVHSPYFAPAHAALVGEGPPALDLPVAGVPETATVTALTPTGMSVDVRASSRSLLVTSDAPYPGWSARVDGRPAPLLTVDYALRGVAVGAGRHRVDFAFVPWSTFAGGAISVIALALTGLLLTRRASVPERV